MGDSFIINKWLKQVKKIKQSYYLSMNIRFRFTKKDISSEMNKIK